MDRETGGCQHRRVWRRGSSGVMLRRGNSVREYHRLGRNWCLHLRVEERQICKIPPIVVCLIVVYSIAHAGSDGTRRRTGGEVKGKYANGVGSQSSCIHTPHSSTASSWLNWPTRRLKWTRPFRRKTNSGFCACAVTFRVGSTPYVSAFSLRYGPCRGFPSTIRHFRPFETYVRPLSRSDSNP